MKPLKLAVAVCSLMIFPGSTMAQVDEAPLVNECLIRPAEITPLREPQFGLPTVWDLLEQGDGMEAFSDIIPLPDNTVVAFGSFTKDKNDAVYHPLIVKYDENLKKLWQTRNATADYKTIHRALKTKDGFAVLGDLQTKSGNGIYVAFYDDAGKLKSENAIYESGGNLDAKGFTIASDTTGYLVAAQFIDGKNNEKQKGILYKISGGGKQLWKRAYSAGNSSVFNNVQPTLDGHYMVTGQIILDRKKSGAWLLKVDNKGAIAWQRTYPRGEAATFQAAAPLKDGSYIVTGKARPKSVNRNLAAWVMKIDSAGNTLWQRYFRGDYQYEAPDLIVYEDGRANILLNAMGFDVDHRSHARLMTLSPEGKIQQMEDFTEGQNASATRLVSGINGEQLTAGFAQTSFGEDQAAGAPAPVYTYDGWLRAGVPLDLYEDPCAPAPDLSPILQ